METVLVCYYVATKRGNRLFPCGANLVPVLALKLNLNRDMFEPDVANP